jgi:O-antigen/teichoic acid export membrane protein
VLAAVVMKARRWKRRILFAIIDQGLSSGTNFLLTILYAAWLPLESFGQYVILWTVALFIEVVQISLIIDPLPTLASRFGPTNRERIDAAAAWVTLAYGGATSLVLLAAIPLWSVSAPEMAVPLVCLAAINPVQRLYIFIRRLAYIRDRQDAAAVGSLTFFVTMLAGAFTLHQLRLLDLVSILLLWGIGAAAAMLVTCTVGVPWLRAARAATVVWLARNVWYPGRWLVGAAVCFWISQWGIFPLAAAMGGPDGAGVMRVLQNLFTPVTQFNAALYLALLPRVADNVAAKGHPYARSFALYGTIAFTGIVIVYSALVLIGAGPIIAVLYRKPEILGSIHLLWPLAIAFVLEAARQAPAMAMLAENRTRTAFVARVGAVLAFFAAAAALGPLMGVEGLLWANAVANGVGTSWQMIAALAVKKQEATRRAVLQPTPS